MNSITIKEDNKLKVIIHIEEPIKIVQYAGLKMVPNEENGIVERVSNGIKVSVTISGPPNITQACLDSLDPIINQMINS